MCGTGTALPATAEKNSASRRSVNGSPVAAGSVRSYRRNSSRDGAVSIFNVDEPGFAPATAGAPVDRCDVGAKYVFYPSEHVAAEGGGIVLLCRVRHR